MHITTSDARMELAVLNAHTGEYSKAGILAQLKKKGLTDEELTIAEEIWEHNEIIAGQTFSVGKIILVEVLNFSRANPKLPVAVLVGAAIATLSSMAPCLQRILAPMQSTAPGNSKEIVALAEHFFALLAAIFNVLEDELARG